MSSLQTLTPPLPLKTIHQFPNPTFIENLAIRSNGQVLATLLTTPELYLIDPITSKASLVASFPNSNALTGVIEVDPDLFYVAAGTFNVATATNEAGSYSIWEVDLRSFDTDGKAPIKHITALPDAALPNGFELLSQSAGIFLFADSTVGAVFKVNVKTGEHGIAVQVEDMKAPPPPAFPFGANGIKIHDGYLYWSNTGKATLCRIKIDGDGHAVGETEILATDTLIDDFAVDAKGNAWLAQAVINTVAVVKAGGGVVTVAGKADELTVAGGTACLFGRGEHDGHILYLVTNGGIVAPINGTETEGGKLVAIDTSSFYN